MQPFQTRAKLLPFKCWTVYLRRQTWKRNTVSVWNLKSENTISDFGYFLKFEIKVQFSDTFFCKCVWKPNFGFGFKHIRVLRLQTFTVVTVFFYVYLQKTKILRDCSSHKLFCILDGKMFPSRGDLHVAPFQDEALYMEQINKVNFWYQDYFHGVNLSSLRDAAMKEYFRQPIVSQS